MKFMVGDFGWEHEGTKSGVGTVKKIDLYPVMDVGTNFCAFSSPLNKRFNK